MYKLELDTAIKAAKLAGDEILKVYSTDFGSELKSDNSPVTIADKRANKVIVDLLSSIFPSYSILAEESEDDLTRLDNTFCWIVDPLDGTKEFIKKNDEFTVNIALTNKGIVELGVIYIPVTKELYYAYKDYGAYYENSELPPKPERIYVSRRKKDLIVVRSKSHSTEKLIKMLDANKDRIESVIPLGSSIKGCHIAHGKADVYYKFDLTSQWDTAAMQCIVEEAGGIFKELNGENMTYDRKETLNLNGFYILNDPSNKLDINPTQ